LRHHRKGRLGIPRLWLLVPTSCALGRVVFAMKTRKLSRIDRVAIELMAVAYEWSSLDILKRVNVLWWRPNASHREYWRRVARRAIELAREMDAGEKGR